MAETERHRCPRQQSCGTRSWGGGAISSRDRAVMANPQRQSCRAVEVFSEARAVKTGPQRRIRKGRAAEPEQHSRGGRAKAVEPR